MEYLARIADAADRLRLQERHERLEDQARVNGIEWGKVVKGQMPSSKSKWWMSDEGFRDYLLWLQDQYAPLTPEAVRKAQQAKEEAFVSALIGRRVQA